MCVSSTYPLSTARAVICPDYGFTLIYAQLVNYHRYPTASLRSISWSCSCAIISLNASESANSRAFRLINSLSVVLDGYLFLLQANLEHPLRILGKFGVFNFHGRIPAQIADLSSHFKRVRQFLGSFICSMIPPYSAPLNVELKTTGLSRKIEILGQQ